MQSCAASAGGRDTLHSRRRWKKAYASFQARWRLTDAAGRAVRPGKTPVWKLLFSERMRQIKLTGREATVVRAIGFAESMLGAEIQDFTRMELEDVTDALNSLMAAGFVESIPYYAEVQLAEMPVTAFEVNPAYVHELKQAVMRR